MITNKQSKLIVKKAHTLLIGEREFWYFPILIMTVWCDTILFETNAISQMQDKMNLKKNGLLLKL